jgi:predicted secreted hydrolase
MRRRAFLRHVLRLAAAAGLGSRSAPAAEFAYAPVTAGTPLQFPRDHGSHPDHRIEWWYLTGWLNRGTTRDAPACGFQVTFFRVRTALPAGSSRFTATQLLFAHGAVSDPHVGHILHEERAARAGFGLAESATHDTAVHIRGWNLWRETTGTYQAAIHAREFTLRLTAQPTQPLMLQGRDGFSQKGPAIENTSYYYSQPQLHISGDVSVRGQRERVSGIAWLDHEWSSALMPAGAAGWDWLGLNDDGGALTAFQMRSDNPQAPAVWSYAKWRSADGSVSQPARDAISFTPVRHWTSPNGARYPVQTRITLGTRTLYLQPLFDAQELATQTTGNTYWEGAVTAFDSGEAHAKPIGRGYWELTGYSKRQRL